jgi:predicted ATP-dependent protease
VLKESEGWQRYAVNLFVDNREAQGAPVVYEANPTLFNLIGRVDHRSVMGTMVTDVSLIRAGALHRANGGYLVLDALRLLTNPWSWEELKRALRSNAVRVESPAQLLSLVSTVSLEPEPVPLDIRIVLIGERWLYYLLSAVDPEFGELFKVAADFETDVNRDQALDHYLSLIATKVREEKLRPFHRDAMARVVEHSGRMADDAEKLTVRMSSIIELLVEADY